MKRFDHRAAKPSCVRLLSTIRLLKVRKPEDRFGVRLGLFFAMSEVCTRTVGAVLKSLSTEAAAFL